MSRGSWRRLRRLPGALTAAGLLLALGLAGAARAEVTITPKHLVILRPGVDSVWGSYVFAIQNTGDKDEAFKSQVMLPKETADFVPQEGLTPDQISLSEHGVVIDGKFPSGVHIVSIGFKVDARFGAAELTFTPVSDVQSFTVLVPRDSGVTATGVKLAAAEDGSSPDPQYIALLVGEPMAVGKPYQVTVAGIPEGRLRIWIVGWAVAGVMVLMAFAMALRTRPKITGDANESVLVG